MQVRRLHDLGLVASTLAHPRIHPHVSDDFSPSPAAVAEAMRGASDTFIFLGVFEGEQYRGVFMFHPHNGVCHEVHVALLPSAWGRSAECLRLACAWMFEHTACRRVVASVPACNPLALRLAERAGLLRHGLNRASFLRGGVLHDQVLFGLSKP
jgi:RimJ/RimL family protein N-acetyltransferase